MLPVVGSLAGKVGVSQIIMIFALLIGSCLGGNITQFGATANIVAVGILNKHKYKVSFLEFIKIGLPFTIVTLLFSSILLWFVWKNA